MKFTADCGKFAAFYAKTHRNQPFRYRFARSCAGFLIFIKKFDIIYIEVEEKYKNDRSCFKSKREKGELFTMPYTTFAN